jgi:predicted peptidase
MNDSLQGLIVALALGTLLAQAGLALADETGSPGPGKQRPQHLDRQVRVQLNYLLYLPKDYDQQQSLPMLLFLHGAGERGDDLGQVKKHGPPKLIDGGKHFPFIVVSPQCPKDAWWQPQELLTLVDEIVEKYKVDEDRVYVTGLSMGGFGAWSLLGVAPKRFAAAAPICGGGQSFLARSGVPVWVFHGAKDPVVPLEFSERMVAAVKEAGGEVKFTVYPDAGHDSWTETYENPELYTWLLEHRRGDKE